MTRLPLLCGLAALLVAPTPAADPKLPPDIRTRAEELVRELGSPAFADRDRATRELRKMGRLALTALIAARRDDNPEVRMRAALLLPTAEADDLRIRLDAFVADHADPAGAGLPGWAKFRQVAGDDKPARELFAEVVRNPVNRSLLTTVGGAPADLTPGLEAVAGGVAGAGLDRAPAAMVGRAVVVRRLQMYGQYGPQAISGSSVGRGPDIPEIAALILAEGFTSERLAPQTNTQYFTLVLLDTSAVKEASGGGGRYGRAFQQLAIHWLDTRDNPQTVAGCVRYARTLRLPTSIQARCAARVCGFPGLPQFDRINAIQLLGASKAVEHLPALAKVFTDRSPIPRRGGVENVLQMRDIALAAAVELIGQDPTEYGFAEGNGTFGGRNGKWGFPQDEEEVPAVRAAAFAKWRAWETTVYGAAGGPAAAFATAETVWQLKPPNPGP